MTGAFVGGYNLATNFIMKLPQEARDDADRRIAENLRSDATFMAELRRNGIFVEDTANRPVSSAMEVNV